MERDSINLMRDKLYEMVGGTEGALFSGEILKVSQELDKLISDYYKKQIKKFRCLVLI